MIWALLVWSWPCQPPCCILSVTTLPKFNALISSKRRWSDAISKVCFWHIFCRDKPLFGDWNKYFLAAPKSNQKKKTCTVFIQNVNQRNKTLFHQLKKTHLIEIQRPLKSHLDEGGWSQWRTDSACRITIDSPTGCFKAMFSQKWTWDVEIYDPE